MKLQIPILAGIALVALGVGPGGQMVNAQSAPNGEMLFRQRCAMCHSVTAKQVPLGPNLAGVVGRKAGVTGFNYSQALKASGLTWSQANLDRYLAAPTKLVPGTKMVVAVPSAAQRAAITNYLTTAR